MRDRIGLRLALVIATAAVAQIFVFALLRPAGVAPDVLFVVAIAGGLVAGDRRGAITGFAAGVTLDLMMVVRPVGMAALVFTVVGYLAGRYQVSARAETTAGVVTAAAALTIAGSGLYGLLGQLFGQGDIYGGRFVVVALVGAVWSALLVFPVRAVLSWAWMVRAASRTGVR